MKIDLNFSELFAQPIEEVWRAITDRPWLARWLMENDFEARVGARFTLRQADPSPWWRGHVECEVLELERPKRMVWSWADGSGSASASRVIFELSGEGSRTRLTIRHVGDEPEEVAKMIRERWPLKLRMLVSVLGGEL